MRTASPSVSWSPPAVDVGRISLPSTDSRRGGMAARLRAARSRSFVGRRAERDLFRSALTADDVPPFAVLHVHGPAGVGKSALLGQFALEARTAGRRTIWVDGRSIDPTPDGFQDALAAHLHVEVADALSALTTHDAPVLLIDSYELLDGLDDWLRIEVLPRLPRRALVVMAGRRPPSPAWRSDPGWDDLLRVVCLRDLRPDEARALLRMRDVEDAHHAEALAVAHGHPLALLLVADVLRRHDGAPPLSADDARDVIVTLLDRYLGRLPSEAHRRALHATAHAGFATEGMLRDTVSEESASELFDWVRQLSFSEYVSSGVALHDLVGEALDTELRWRDPEGYAALHRSVLDHLGRRTLATTGPEQDRAMLDLLHMYRHHPITGPFLTAGRAGLRMESVTPDDHDAILAMTRRHEGETSAGLAAWWLERQPEAFVVFRRGAEPDPVGFAAHVLVGDAPGEETAVDPVASAVWDHVRAHAPLRSGERIRLMRFWVAQETHQEPDTFHLVSTRAAVDYVLTEGLAWAFGAITDIDVYDDLFRFVGYHPAADAIAVDGDHAVGLFARDMREMSRHDWWRTLGERMISDAEDLTRLPQLEQRLLVLSREEFEEAVRDALRGVRHPGGLDGNPLLRSRVVVEFAEGHPPTGVLTDLLERAVHALAGHPCDEKLYRALDRTYLRPAPTQEAAAEVLDLPFSTFRRHLAAGIDHVVSWLWHRELHGHRAYHAVASRTTASSVKVGMSEAGDPPRSRSTT